MHVLPVTLTDEVHAELERIATEIGRPATLLAHDAIATWLESRRREGLRVRPEIDLEPELEDASVEIMIVGHPKHERDPVEIVVPPDLGGGLPPKARRRIKR